jgi:hypothetical protein
VFGLIHTSTILVLFSKKADKLHCPGQDGTTFVAARSAKMGWIAEAHRFEISFLSLVVKVHNALE